MKKFLLIIGLALSTMAFGQAASKDDVLNALKKGDAVTLSGYFDNTLDVKLPDKTEAKGIAKDDAGKMVKDFYKQNGVKGFDLASDRAMGGTMYLAGKLTGGSKEYNLTLMLKNKDGQMSVITVRIN
ncbi:MAG TPA: DUF4783 domain-containing protein [Chitinophagaceae bacterium]|jgi:hypothetical protein|nr:DUF4783 domain-containing protein [Chitinophagaceae bacterium]